MIRAAIYVRVSTDQQVQEGDSIPAQLDALTKYVNDRPDMVLAGEYIDEGISGQKADRDELQRLLDDVKAGKIDQILFTKLDRWFRSVRHYTATQELLDKQGVTWTAVWEPVYDTTTPAGRLIVNQMMSIAQFESENTGQRIRQVMNYKVTQGEAVTGTVPIGYRIQDKHLVIDPETEAIGRSAFEIYNRTGSLGETCRQLQAMGYTRQKQNLKYMLRNKKYIGEHRGNQNYCPPLVSRELFDAVQRKLSMNVSVSAKYTNVFRGLLKCGCCGRSMAAGHDMHKGQGYHYYRCPGYYVAPRRCENRTQIGERVLENILIDELPDLAEKTRLEAVAMEEKRVDHSKQVAVLDRKISRLKDLYLAEQITLDEYKADRADLERQKLSLVAPEAPKKDVKAVNDILSIHDLKAVVSALTQEEKRVFWRGVIKEIFLFPDHHTEIHFL